ncbi:MAG: hypothetical protein JW841_17085 [Deltaproteobacteria bacterium]|nr:hypothetical protein [Deltaproteobacteria bacterium]
MRPTTVNIDNPRLGQDIFEARLSEVLLEHGIIRPEGLQEALRQQVLLGGHLATNLWELNFVDGKELTRISAELLNIAVADPRDIANADLEIRRLFTKEHIEQLRLLPIRVVGSVLQVATSEPWDLLTLGRAAFHCGYPVEPFFLAEVPLAALMEKIYGIPTTVRFWFGIQSNERVTPKLVPRTTADNSSIFSKKSSLVSDVQREISKIRNIRTQSPVIIKNDDQAPINNNINDTLISENLSNLNCQTEVATSITKQNSEIQTSSLNDVQLGNITISDRGIAPEAAISAATEAAVSNNNAAKIINDSRAAPASTMAPTFQPPPINERLIVAPLTNAQAAAIEAPPDAIATFAEANSALALANDRDEVGLVLLRFALSKAKRVVVFVRRALLWAGWMGAGEGVNVTHLHTLLMPTAPGTIFGLVANTGAHFIGPLQPSPAYAPFLSALGGGRPATAALLPIHFNGRLIFGLYLDAGPQKRVTADIGDLIVLAQRVPSALERLIQSRFNSRK